MARVWDDLAMRIGQLDDPRDTQASILYDAAGNVTMTVKRVNGMQEEIWSGWIGQVEVADLPGKFGELTNRQGAIFGTAIEPRINQLVSDVTNGMHIQKHGNTTGTDYAPVVGIGRAAND